MRNNQRTTLGFTILEILLVIAIIGTLTTIGITAYQKYSTQGKLNLAAQQMQGIMEAASAYYVAGRNPNAKNHWPAMTGATVVMPDDFLPFLPIKYNTSKVTVNPWGYSYYIDGSSDFKFKIMTFTKTPEMAKRLAGMIPFATVDPSSPNNVTAYIPVPGQTIPTGLIPLAIGVAKNGTVINNSKLAVCPSGTSMQSNTAISLVRTDLSDISTWWGPDTIIASPATLVTTANNLQSDKKSWKISTSLKKAGDCDVPWYCGEIDWGGDCDPKKHCNDKNQGADPNPWGSPTKIDVQTNAFYMIYCRPNSSD